MPAPATLKGLLIEALQAFNYGRWRWDELDCSWTGKDADLEACGQQGCTVDACDADQCTVTVHAGKSLSGTDVCLNTPENITDEQQDAVHDLWMDQAQLCIEGAASEGEWDGDSWYMKYCDVITVPLVKVKGKIDMMASASAVIAACEKELEDWEREMQLCDDSMNELAGWTASRKGRGPRRCKEGRPGRGSVWSIYRESLK